MKPILVHRYSWRVNEAIEALLGDTVGDAAGWRMRVEGDELVIDIVAPRSEEAVSRPVGTENPSVAKALDHESHSSDQAAKIIVASPEPEQTAQPELKGGALARSAAIMGGEKGFWIFAEKKHGVFLASADDARAWFCKTCAIKSRAELDHDARAAAIFKPIEKAYRLRLEGYD